MSFGTFLGGVGSLLGLGTSVAGTWSQNQANADNLKYQQDVLDWQKQAQETTWNREDTAVQRRAADLEAAGLSKTLAAGGAASTSAPVHLDAPHKQANQYNVKFDALQQMQMSQEFANKQAENRYISGLADKAHEEAEYVKSQRKVYDNSHKTENDNGTEPKSPIGKIGYDLRNNPVFQKLKSDFDNLLDKSKQWYNEKKSRVENVNYEKPVSNSYSVMPKFSKSYYTDNE